MVWARPDLDITYGMKEIRDDGSLIFHGLCRSEHAAEAFHFRGDYFVICVEFALRNHNYSPILSKYLDGQS